MRAVIQRVTSACVTVGARQVGAIGAGLLALVGVEDGDCAQDAQYIAEKIMGLRIFEDAAGKMNLSIRDAGGALLLVSQFTLLGDARKGRRPSFDRAAKPEAGAALFGAVVEILRGQGLAVETGEFGAHMSVQLVNDGPVTILLDSRKLF